MRYGEDRKIGESKRKGSEGPRQFKIKRKADEACERGKIGSEAIRGDWSRLETKEKSGEAIKTGQGEARRGEAQEF